MKSLQITAAVLGLLVLASALAVVAAQHRSRALFVELQQTEDEVARLETEWGRLQLEQSTWATQGRIERVAREEIGMRVPPFDEVEVVIVP